jgi:hypothetical protein
MNAPTMAAGPRSFQRFRSGMPFPFPWARRGFERQRFFLSSKPSRRPEQRRRAFLK